MHKSYDTFRIRATLPDELLPLNELAYNLHWTWSHKAIELFRRLDNDLWDDTKHNPVKMLGSIKQDKLSQALQDEGFMDQMHRAHQNMKEHLNNKS